MSAAPPIELVVFDLGRVLVRICDGWGDAARRAGVQEPVEHPSGAARAAFDALVADYETARIPHARFCDGVADLLGIRAASVDAILRVYLLGLFDGAEGLLRALRGAGLRTACLSNTNAEHWPMNFDPRGPVRLDPALLDHRFASNEMRLRKPDPAIYAAVERACGIAGARIAFFDDLPENIEAARALGWRGVAIDVDGDPIAQARAALRGFGVRGM